MRLPIEIRLMIYERLFPPHNFRIWVVNGHFRRRDEHYVFSGRAALLATCRVIYAEARPVFSASNKFSIDLDNANSQDMDLEKHLPWYQDLCSMVPSRHVQSLSLTFEVEHVYNGSQLLEIMSAVRRATNMKQLHIYFDMFGRFDQSGFDQTMGMLARLESSGSVTAIIDREITPVHYRTVSYFGMLARLEGSVSYRLDIDYQLTNACRMDLTDQEIVNEISACLAEREETSEKLKARTSELMPQTIKSMGTLKDYPHWDEGFITRAQAAMQSINDVLSATLDWRPTSKT